MDSGRGLAGWQWWERLAPATRAWMISNNGDAVPESVAAEVLAAGGPAAQPAGDGALYYPDDVVDWVKATANGEGASGGQ